MSGWREIADGRYEVSWDGVVRRIKARNGSRICRVLHQQNKDGYRSVCLSVRGKARRYYVHRLVAEAFLGPIPPGHVVNHRDGDRWNAAVPNLEFVTYQQNGVEAGRNGQLVQAEQHRFAKATREQVIAMRRAYAAGTPQHQLRKESGLAASTVFNIVHGRTWKSTLGAK